MTVINLVASLLQILHPETRHNDVLPAKTEYEFLIPLTVSDFAGGCHNCIGEVVADEPEFLIDLSSSGLHNALHFDKPSRETNAGNLKVGSRSL